MLPVALTMGGRRRGGNPMRISKEAAEASILALIVVLIGASAVANASIDPNPEEISYSTGIQSSKEDLLVPGTPASDEEDDAALAARGVKISPIAAAPKQFYEHEMIEVLLSVGFEGQALRTAWAVAMKESTGNPLAHNGNSSTGDNSYGLFQINMIGKLGAARMEKYGLSEYDDLFDPYVNARIAFQMSSEGTNWGAWGIGANAYNGNTEGSFYKWYKEYPRGE